MPRTSAKQCDGQAPRKNVSSDPLRAIPAIKAAAKKAAVSGHLLLSSRMGNVSNSGEVVGNVKYCAACHCDADEEEELLTCDACEVAYLCKRCVKNDYRKEEEKDTYLCVRCCKAGGHPYPFELNPPSIRHSHGPPIEPFALILLYLDTNTFDCSSLSATILNIAKAYFPVGLDQVPDVQAFFHSFCFPVDDDGDIQFDQELITKLDDYIATCQRRGIKSYFLVLQTHSDRVDGGVFVNRKAQTSIDNLFRLLLTPKATLALQDAEQSVLLLAACGHTVHYRESFDAIKQTVQRGTFKTVVTFAQPTLQPFIVMPFAVNFTMHLLFSQAEGVRWDAEECTSQALTGQDNFGAHTSVVLFLKDVLNDDGTQKRPLRILEWLWAPSSRPNGVPVICGPSCSTVLKLTNRKGNKGVQMTCESCGNVRWVSKEEARPEGPVDAVTVPTARWVRRRFAPPTA